MLVQGQDATAALAAPSYSQLPHLLPQADDLKKGTAAAEALASKVDDVADVVEDLDDFTGAAKAIKSAEESGKAADIPYKQKILDFLRDAKASLGRATDKAADGVKVRRRRLYHVHAAMQLCRRAC